MRSAPAVPRATTVSPPPPSAKVEGTGEAGQQHGDVVVAPAQQQRGGHAVGRGGDRGRVGAVRVRQVALLDAGVLDDRAAGQRDVGAVDDDPSATGTASVSLPPPPVSWISDDAGADGHRELVGAAGPDELDPVDAAAQVDAAAAAGDDAGVEREGARTGQLHGVGAAARVGHVPVDRRRQPVEVEDRGVAAAAAVDRGGLDRRGHRDAVDRRAADEHDVVPTAAQHRHRVGVAPTRVVDRAHARHAARGEEVGVGAAEAVGDHPVDARRRGGRRCACRTCRGRAVPLTMIWSSPPPGSSEGHWDSNRSRSTR